MMARIGLAAKALRLAAALFASVAATGPTWADGFVYQLSAKDQAIYRSAFAALLQDRWAEARLMAGAAKDKLPAKIILWMDLTRPGPGRSFDEMTRFLKENANWPRREALIRQAERAMPTSLPDRDVVQWFDGRKPMTAEGTLKLLAALTALKQKELAQHVAEAAWVALDFDRTQEEEFKRRFGHLIPQHADLARLDRLLWEGESDQAVWMLSRVDDGHRALARARMKLAASTPDVDRAVAQVPKALRTDPGLVFERARWNRRRGDDLRAAELLDPPPAELPFAETFWEELERAARAAIERRDYKRAYRLAANHGAEVSEAFAEAEFLAGWVALRHLKEPGKALPHFSRLYEKSRSPITRARGAYWAGRSLDAMKDRSGATDWYRKSASLPLTFYGQLAAARLPKPKPLPLPNSPSPSNEDMAHFMKDELVRASLALNAIGQADLAKPFILKLSEQAANAREAALVGALGVAIGRKDFAILAAKAARPEGFELTEYLYPMAKVDSKMAPEPALILAVIRQESAFDPKIVSPAGAKGLMQLMPSTAKVVAKRLGLTYREADLTANSSYNISLGREYLRQMLDRFGGSYILAAAAYNAGPSRASDWIDRFGDPRSEKIDVIDWMESIPLDETRNYVQRILEGLHIYRARLNGDILTPTSEKELGRAIDG